MLRGAVVAERGGTCREACKSASRGLEGVWSVGQIAKRIGKEECVGVVDGRSIKGKVGDYI